MSINFCEFPIDVSKPIITFLDEKTWRNFNRTCQAFTCASWWSDHHISTFVTKYYSYDLPTALRPDRYYIIRQQMNPLDYVISSDRLKNILEKVEYVASPIFISFRDIERLQNCTVFPLHVNIDFNEVSDFKNLIPCKAMQRVKALEWDTCTDTTATDLEALLPQCPLVETINMLSWDPHSNPLSNLSTHNISISETVKHLCIESGTNENNFTNSSFLSLLKLFPQRFPLFSGNRCSENNSTLKK